MILDQGQARAAAAVEQERREMVEFLARKGITEADMMGMKKSELTALQQEFQEVVLARETLIQ